MNRLIHVRWQGLVQEKSPATLHRYVKPSTRYPKQKMERARLDLDLENSAILQRNHHLPASLQYLMRSEKRERQREMQCGHQHNAKCELYSREVLASRYWYVARQRDRYGMVLDLSRSCSKVTSLWGCASPRGISCMEWLFPLHVVRPP